MLLNIILFAALAAGAQSSVHAQNRTLGRCGTAHVPDSFAKTVSELKSKENAIKLRARSSNKTSSALPTIDVNVHFHTVSSENKRDSISDDSINKQFVVLQDVYAKYDINIQWDRTIASRTVDDFLATGQWPLTREQIAAKKEWLTKTRKGGYDNLNVYFCRCHSEKAELMDSINISRYRYGRRILG